MDNCLCTLPLTNMMVLRNGVVRVCCYNPIPMGNLTNQSIEEIWHGEIYTKLRNALQNNDFSFGCNNGDCPIFKRLNFEHSH